MAESKFVKIKCPDCDNEQIVFTRASSKVSCQVCGATIAEPSGGRAKLKGEITQQLE
ncbi:MAG: 30S ribosomal protein S27e [Candidatus Thermoplasmatota archaeon]|nr:30S ribosomal protein S27e [Candidatus Thermoplasmatota archaeon]